MRKSDLATAALLTAVVPIAACNYAHTDRETHDATVTAPVDQGPVGTSGTPPAKDDDATVTSRIQAKYFLDEMLKRRRIDVDTQSGVVTLRGDVASDNERAQALLLARTTEGVDRVEDALTVNAAIEPPQPDETASDAPVPPSTSDETLTSRVQASIAADPSLTQSMIAVTAKNGVVVLDGITPNAAAKHRAITTARTLDGVVQVIDRVRVAR